MKIKVVEIDLDLSAEEALDCLAKAGLIVTMKNSSNTVFYCAGRGVNKAALKAYVCKKEKQNVTS